MSGITTGIGLISGLNIEEIVTALINAQRTAVVRMEQRVKSLQATNLGYDAIETTLLTLKSAAVELGKSENFNKLTTDVPDGARLSVTAGSNALPGSYRFQAVRRAASHQMLSDGFAEGATLGAGTVSIATGGRLETSRTLDLLNGGAGVRRGAIRITDRTGQSAVVDLAGAQTVDDVLEAINGSNLALTARTVGDRFVLEDTSGSTAANLSVADLNGGQTARDLGLLQSVASPSLTGSSVYYATDDFTLSEINDGNALDLATGLADLRITHAGGSFEVDLDEAKTLGDVLTAINTADDNGGTVTASLASGRIVLTDSAGGPLTVEDVNGASAVRELGIGGTAAGGTLTGGALTGGLSSVLLRNLFGGAGVTQLGSVTLTDRAGNSATVDLSAAETLDDVMQAINSAETTGGTKLGLMAQVDDGGTRIRVMDTTGSTANNLVIADVTGTLADQFGIAVDAAESAVTSGRLNLRYVSGGTSLSTYARDGGPVAFGSFRITDANGVTSTVNVDSTVKTLDDLFARIRTSAPGVGVELNSTGDGFRLYSLSGTGSLAIEESGSTTAADLGILGTGTPDGGGASQIVSRQTVEIAVESGDTLAALVSRINATSAPVVASVFNDGTTLAPQRLSLTAERAGRAGRLVIDDGGLGLGLATRQEAEDALLRVGEGTGGFLLASSSNTFRDAINGLDVEVLGAAAESADVTVARDDSKVGKMLEDFVSAYNTVLSAVEELTKFDPATSERGALQGDPLVLRTTSRLETAISGLIGGAEAEVRSLIDLGIRQEEGGKLSLDTERLNDKLAENPEAVSEFFLQATTGFADRLEATLNSFTDRFTGTFTLQQDVLQDSIDSLTDRIEELDTILEGRRERLLMQFIQMEQALGALQSQQQALGSVQPIKAPAASSS